MPAVVTVEDPLTRKPGVFDTPGVCADCGTLIVVGMGWTVRGDDAEVVCHLCSERRAGRT